MEGLTFVSGNKNDLNGTFSLRKPTAPAPTNNKSTGGNTGGGGYQVGGWYNGRQWTGSGFGEPGQVVVGGGNNNNSSQSSEGGEPNYESQISELYAPALATLSQIEADLKAGNQEDTNLIQKQFDTGVSRANADQTDLLTANTTEEGKFNKGLDSAYEQSIRDYNALQQQGISRFGGGSSAGRAIGELAQREYFRNQGKITDTRTQGSQEFAAERTKISRYVKEKLDDLSLRRDDAMNQLKKQLRDGLSQISLKKNEVEANKTRERMSLLQQTVGQANAIKAADIDFRQRLGLAAISQMQEVEGRVFTPEEIKATLAQFGISLPTSASASQTYTPSIQFNPSTGKDEFNQTSIYG